MKTLKLRTAECCVHSLSAPALRMCSDWKVRFAEAISASIVKNAKHFKCYKQSRGRSLLANFSPPLEKCVGIVKKLLGIVAKIWSPTRKLFTPAGDPSWLRAWLQICFI